MRDARAQLEALGAARQLVGNAIFSLEVSRCLLSPLQSKLRVYGSVNVSLHNLELQPTVCDSVFQQHSQHSAENFKNPKPYVGTMLLRT